METRCIHCGRTVDPRVGRCICIPNPPVKKPKNTNITITVDATDLDLSLNKAKELIGVLEKIDGLTGRIARDIEKINAYTLGKHI